MQHGGRMTLKAVIHYVPILYILHILHGLLSLINYPFNHDRLTSQPMKNYYRLANLFNKTALHIHGQP